MYKLILVDDEIETRNRINNILDFNSLGFDVVGLFENGIDALEYIENHKDIDLVITDIKMPFMTGLELTSKLKKMFPLIKSIIITGFDDFTYAKEAIDAGVIGYIMKPITSKEFQTILIKAKDILDKENEAFKSLAELEEIKTKSKVYLTDTLLNSIIKEPINEFNIETIRFLNLNFDYKSFLVLCFKLESGSEFAVFEQRQLALKSIIISTLSSTFDLEVFNHNEKTVAIIKNNEWSFSSEQLLDNLLNSIISKINKYYHSNISVGVSTILNNLTDIKELYRQADHSLSHVSLLGDNNIYYYKNLNSKSSSAIYDENDFKQLRYLIRYGEKEQLERLLDKFEVNATKFTNIYDYNFFLSQIVHSILNCSENPDTIFAHYGEDLYDIIRKKENVKSSFEFIRELTNLTININQTKINNDFSNIINKAIEFINANYTRPELNLDDLSENMSLSISYLCALFKKEKNTTFVKILTEVRMEKAKELLNDNSLKIVDIAEMVGFIEPYYFSHTFKKYFGISPKEFRSKNEKN